MHLEKIELQGFKTFASKTSLEFLPPRAEKKGITAIVGPNGSGKSNVADAVRWAMGEQSIKLLRGKKSEDVIFSGTPKRARAGFAEVSLYLNNESRAADIDYTEVVLTRRLYRDGQTEYFINKNKTRLQDIQLLLAQANFGPRTYSVIGQGMVDHILVASPQERKEFFDEAAGVKQFQIKRQTAINKLQNSRDNLNQAVLVIGELEPRLRSLSRLAKRLERREETEAKLHELQQQYYGTLWNEIIQKLSVQQNNFKAVNDELTSAKAKLDQLNAEFEKMEKETPRSETFYSLQGEYQKLVDQKSRLKEEYYDLQKEIELSSIKEKKEITVPLASILADLEKIDLEYSRLAQMVQKGQDSSNLMGQIQKMIQALIGKLKQPDAQRESPELGGKLEKISQELKNLDRSIIQAQEKINEFNKKEEQKRTKFFEMQRELQKKSREANEQETRVNDIKIEIAKLETRSDGLEQEMRQELGSRIDQVKSSGLSKIDPNEIYPEMSRLKHTLELIGAIDEETMDEYRETKERYDYLKEQTDDLGQAIESLTMVIEELDEQIKTQSESAFKKLNQQFQEYFKILFGGGEAKLVQVSEEVEEREAAGEETDEEDIEVITDKKTGKKKKIITGIEIQATPPGKRLKSINALSGGERALTSIALICSIMANNPSPFVVLDEVDAALDESNSIKFANIVDGLSRHTQFIIITHNRATMNKARALYGVTMSDDGVSKLLSVQLEEAEKIAA